MTAAVVSQERALSARLGDFRRSAAVLVLMALCGPIWNVILVALPGASLTVGRGLIALGAVLLALDARRAPRPLPAVPRAVWLLLGALAALWAWAAASAVGWGCGCAGELAGLGELVAVTALAAALATFEPRVRPALVLAIVAGAALTAIMTLAGVDGLSAGTRSPSPDLARLSGPYGNPNFLAFALAFAIPAALAACRACEPRLRIALRVALVLVAVVLLLTYSRGALLAAAAGAVVVLVLARPARSRARRQAIAGIALAAVAAAVAYPVFVQERREASSVALGEELRAQDRSGWDASTQGLIPGEPTRMSNPSPGVLAVRTDGPGRGVSRRLGPARAGGTYELRFEARAASGTSALRFGLEDNTLGNGPAVAATTLDEGWRALRLRWRPTADSPSARLYVWAPAAGDGFELRAVMTIARAPGEPDVTTAHSTALLGTRADEVQAQRERLDARDVRTRRVGVELSLDAFASQPLRGIGWGRFVAYSGAHSEFNRLPTHDEYLRFLAELGIVGVALLALAGLAVATALRGGGPLDVMGIALLGMLVTGVVGLVFVNALSIVAIAAPLGIAAALACARAGPRDAAAQAEATSWWPAVHAGPAREEWDVVRGGLRRARTRTSAYARRRARRGDVRTSPRGRSDATDGSRPQRGARSDAADGLRLGARSDAAAEAPQRPDAHSDTAAGAPQRPDAHSDTADGARLRRRARSAARAVAAGVERLRRAAPTAAPEGWSSWLALVERGLRRMPRAARAALRAEGRRGATGAMRRHAGAAALVLLAVVTAVAIGGGAHAEGMFAETNALELGVGATTPGERVGGPVSKSVDGYLAGPGASTARVRLTLPRPGRGRTLLRVWAYSSPDVRTVVALRAADGSERTLGRATLWRGRTFDVTEQARLGPAALIARADNAGRDPTLFLDRVAPVVAPASLALTAPAWSVGLLVALIAAALLALARRLARHWPLPLLLGATAAALWHEIAAAAFRPLGVEAYATRTAAGDASWLGLHDGALSGSWRGLSSLAVTLGHALTPIVGTAPSSARAAALVVALLALAAIYALAARAAGRGAAVLVVLLAVAAGGFRDGVVAGGSLPALVLAGALFAYALHACVARASSAAIAVLGATAALLVLAEPAWLAGALAAVVVVALARAGRGSRLRIAGTGLVAVVVCLLPHLASTASQNDGALLAGVQARAIAARNAEFPFGVHGAPTPADLLHDPLSGRPVSLEGYLFSLHSPGAVASGAAAGARESLAALKPSGGVGLALLVAGALFVLWLPGLRLLALVPALVAAPTLFMADHGGLDPAAAGAVAWPALLACAAILATAVARVARLREGARRLTPAAARLRLPRTLGGAAAPSEHGR